MNHHVFKDKNSSLFLAWQQNNAEKRVFPRQKGTQKMRTMLKTCPFHHLTSFLMSMLKANKHVLLPCPPNWLMIMYIVQNLCWRSVRPAPRADWCVEVHGHVFLAAVVGGVCSGHVSRAWTHKPCHVARKLPTTDIADEDLMGRLVWRKDLNHTEEGHGVGLRTAGRVDKKFNFKEVGM